jgi:hypothetical protein
MVRVEISLYPVNLVEEISFLAAKGRPPRPFSVTKTDVRRQNAKKHLGWGLPGLTYKLGVGALGFEMTY